MTEYHKEENSDAILCIGCKAPADKYCRHHMNACCHWCGFRLHFWDECCLEEIGSTESDVREGLTIMYEQLNGFEKKLRGKERVQCMSFKARLAKEVM